MQGVEKEKKKKRYDHLNTQQFSITLKVGDGKENHFSILKKQ
jgi:hypothetical protein